MWQQLHPQFFGESDFLFFWGGVWSHFHWARFLLTQIAPTINSVHCCSFCKDPLMGSSRIQTHQPKAKTSGTHWLIGCASQLLQVLQASCSMKHSPPKPQICGEWKNGIQRKVLNRFRPMGLQLLRRFKERYVPRQLGWSWGWRRGKKLGWFSINIDFLLRSRWRNPAMCLNIPSAFTFLIPLSARDF